MGGQVLGGGIVFLVAVGLWMLYLLPSWHSSRQFNAAERNAVRLNQALRVLAETSETPGEVRLELSTRTALAQQRLARQTMAEQERARLEGARIELERARAEALALRAHPDARRARARRRTRVCATLLGIASVVATGVGGWMLFALGAQTLLWVGGVGILISVAVLQRMSAVSARAALRASAPAAEVRPAVVVQDVRLEQTPRATWEPRAIPRALASSAGSRAAVMRDAADAREALRAAALDEAKRERAERAAPPSIDTARIARAEGEKRTQVGKPAASSPFARMGYVDDAEIEEHVRLLLDSRRAG